MIFNTMDSVLGIAYQNQVPNINIAGLPLAKLGSLGMQLEAMNQILDFINKQTQQATARSITDTENLARLGVETMSSEARKFAALMSHNAAVETQAARNAVQKTLGEMEYNLQKEKMEREEDRRREDIRAWKEAFTTILGGKKEE